MFNTISIMDLASSFCAIIALIVLIAGWRGRFTNPIKYTIAGLFVLTLFHDFTNFLEWGGIANIFGAEYYIEILVPVLWFLVVYFFSQDTTTHRLLEAMNRYKTLFAAAGEAIFIVDVTNPIGPKFVDCNNATLRVFGCDTKEDVIGKSPQDFSPPVQPGGISSKQRVAEVGRRAFEGEKLTFEWKHMRLDGTIFDAEVRLNRIELDNNFYVLAMVHDITDRKKIENLKNTIVRDVSHTLKSPLAVVKMACAMMEKGIEKGNMENVQRGQQIAKDNIDRAVKDIENILKMASLEGAGPMGIGESISLKDLFKEIIGDMPSYLANKPIELVINISLESDKVFGFESDLRMLFENLLENAYKFTEKGKISVNAKLNGSTVDITVSDTGCGIRDENIDRVFEKFYKRHSAMEGIGLGLSICKEIINRNEGKIKISSDGENKGTTVVISLAKGE